MWGKLKRKLSQPDIKDTRTTYDKHFSFDFSDGPPPNIIPVLWPDAYGDDRYPSNGYTVTPFIESLALENLVAPLRRMISPEIKIIPPTPPWVSRQNSKENSPTREGARADSPGHRKALSDSPLSTVQGRTDAVRRGRETARAEKVASKAAIDPAFLKAIGAEHRVINWSRPMSLVTLPPIQTLIITPRGSSLHRATPDVPEDVGPDTSPYDGVVPNSPPFEFDD